MKLIGNDSHLDFGSIPQFWNFADVHPGYEMYSKQNIVPHNLRPVSLLVLRRLIPHTTWTTVITPSITASITTSASRDVILPRDVILARVRLEPRVLERVQDFVRRWDRTRRFARRPSEKPKQDTLPEIESRGIIVILRGSNVNTRSL